MGGGAIISRRKGDVCPFAPLREEEPDEGGKISRRGKKQDPASSSEKDTQPWSLKSIREGREESILRVGKGKESCVGNLTSFPFAPARGSELKNRVCKKKNKYKGKRKKMSSTGGGEKAGGGLPKGEGRPTRDRRGEAVRKRLN